MKTEAIILENNKRLEVFNKPYNPILGIGSPIEREKLILDDLGEFYIPKPFFNSAIGAEIADSGSLGKFVERNISVIPNIDQASSMFIKERVKHDFEYWTAIGVKIKPKSGGDFIPYILNAPQRKLHAVIYDKILKKEPIRIIICKSRQWGGSTCIQNEMAHIQLNHKTNWNSLIAAHINQAATNIRGMFTNMQRRYPSYLGAFTLKPYEGQSNVKIIPERSNKITVGSIMTPDSIRSDDVAMAHLSEVGLWRKTEGKEPEDLCQSILGTIPRLPFTMYVLESTAKGVGNFFHRTWQLANAEGSENNGLIPVFVSCLEDKNNQESFKSQSDLKSFIESWNEYEKFLWEKGATIEGIHWYRNKLKELGNDEWRMKSEFPVTADEAFQSSGRRVFVQKYVLNVSKTCRPPLSIGDILSASRRGKKAFENIEFETYNKGNLSIWTMPEPFVEIEGKKYLVSNRYCGFADIGGRTEKADYSELTIIDRYWMIEGGLPEVVAQWHGHLDQDMFAWQCAIIGYWYNKMLLAIETNSLKTEETEGDHFHTILDEIKDYYPNLFIRNKVDSINTDFEPKYGFQTNTQSKGMIMDNLNALLRESGYVERDQRACAQMDYYEVKQNGSLGAVEGQKDDMVITRAGSLWLATKYMPLPKLIPLIPEGQKRNYGGKKIISEASI